MAYEDITYTFKYSLILEVYFFLLLIFSNICETDDAKAVKKIKYP